ncbi:MAG: cysteine hydrolase family protein [Formivibrio sp.]|nr:cysteine hydrolase family protein [Formivibrio sp.]
MTAALLIVDVQAGLFCHPPLPRKAAETIEQINALIGKARITGAPVIFIQHESGPEDGLARGSPGWALHPDLARLPHDRVVAKTACDGFCETALKEALDQLQVSALVVAGYATEFCLDTTLRRAASEGYSVTVAADAHTTKDRPVLKAADIVAHNNWLWANFISPLPLRVLPVQDIVF